ncbi:MAG: Uma2 family endonuclease [Gemmataceae bacterium]|nr:Uma2 family endonuclease [Gemmataceae bacterium]
METVVRPPAWATADKGLTMNQPDSGANSYTSGCESATAKVRMQPEENMATVEQEVPPLKPGLRLTRQEFLRRWELHPEITKAELLGGVVYMPSPVSVEHGSGEGHVGLWIGTYWVATAGTEFGHNTTSMMREDTPQADVHLRIVRECGGASWVEGKFLHGAPELIAEVCLTSADYDLHVKYDLYEAAGVQEYVAVLLERQEICWHALVDGRYELLPPDADGVWRSRVFPGLWLDGPAFLRRDLATVLAKLREGMQTPEHAAFVQRLAERRAEIQGR